jgi:hypothetical protein
MDDLIGLVGTTVRYNAAPSGSARLPLDALALYQQDMDANMEAVQKGKAGEDDSKGYSLSEEPGYRAKQLAMRDYALRQLLAQLTASRDTKLRGGLRRSVWRISSLKEKSR